MHTSRYTDREHATQIIDAWFDSIPEDMALLVRSTPYIVYAAGCETSSQALVLRPYLDQSRMGRLGFYNDGYLGTDGDYGTWGSGQMNFTRAEGRAYLKDLDAPYGGEFATVNEDYFDQNVNLLDPSRHNIVEEWYDTHLSYLRTIRSTNMTVWKRLAAVTFDSATWAFDSAPALDEYDGLSMQKFCEDHMGYRYLVRGVELREGGLALDVENTGFGKILFGTRFDVVFVDASGNEAASVPAEMPALSDLRGGERKELALAFTPPRNLPHGEYDLYLRAAAPLADEDGTALPRRPIRFANENSYDASLRANYICTVSYDGTLGTGELPAEDDAQGEPLRETITIPAGATLTITSPTAFGNADIEIYGTLDCRNDTFFAGTTRVRVHYGGVLGNLNAKSNGGDKGRITVRDEAQLVLETGGRFLHPINGNWANNGLDLSPAEEDWSSLVLAGGEICTYKMSGNGKARILVTEPSDWTLFYEEWWGNDRKPYPFLGAKEVYIASGATLRFKRLTYSFGTDQADGGNITVPLADVPICGEGNVLVANDWGEKHLAIEIVSSANTCTGTIEVEEGANASLSFAPGANWVGPPKPEKGFRFIIR